MLTAETIRAELISLSVNVRKGGGELTLDQVAEQILGLASAIKV